MRRMLRLVAVALVFSLMGTACGDDTSDTNADTRSEQERKADAELAETFQLTLADLPDGWWEDPEVEAEAEADGEGDVVEGDVIEGDVAAGDEDDSMVSELAACLEVDLNVLDRVNPSAQSPTFLSPDQSRVQSEVSATPSEEWAIDRMELFGHEFVISCLKELFLERFTDPANPPPPGVEFGNPQVNTLAFPDMADGATAFRVVIPMTADDTEADIFLDLVMARHGRFGVVMTFQSVFDPFPEDLAEELTQTVVNRIAAAES